MTDAPHGGAPGSPSCDSVLLAGFGGPTAPAEVMPFLRRVVEGRAVPESRLEEVARHYAMLGGRSPYNDLTFEQARGLEASLAASGATLPVHVGFRNAEPSLTTTIGRMVAEGRRRAAGIVLAPHRCEASWERYLRDADRALKESAPGALTIRWVEPWFEDPGFLDACVSRCEEAVPHRRGAWPASLPILFTAHSIPLAMAGREAYVEECLASCRGVAARLGAADWRLVWQSRSGPPHVPWLEPDVLDALRDLARSGTRACVVQAIGFLSDHVEVLYDLDIEAASLARELGMTMHRAPCVNAHPSFIAALTRRVRALAEAP